MSSHQVRSDHSLELFMYVAEARLGKALDPISPFFGLARFLGKDVRKRIAAGQRAELTDTVDKILTTFDPDTVEITEFRRRDALSGRNPRSIGVKAVGTDSDRGINPLYVQGLPNLFVRRDNGGKAEVHMIYIPQPRGWLEPVVIPPPERPAVTFREQPSGEFDFAVGSIGGIEQLTPAQGERLVSTMATIGKMFCDEALRPQLVVYQQQH